MRLLSSLILTAVAGGLATGLAAQTTQAPASDQSAKTTRDPNEVVCEKQEVVGSRLATRKVCMTRAQWADLKSQDRQDVEKVQTMRGMQDH